MTNLGIYTIDHREEESFLRTKTTPFTFGPKGEIKNGDRSFSKQEISKLLLDMKRIMHKANGVGLSANQVGLPYRLFVAQVPSGQGDSKFYAIFNPEIEKYSSEKDTTEEGCLSVLGTYGEVPRAYQVTLRGFDRTGKPLKIKAWGMLARVFQHEVDHLNGMLFVDKAKKLERVDLGS